MSEQEYRLRRQEVAMVDSDGSGAQPVAFGRVLGSVLALFSLAAGAIHLSAASDHRDHAAIFAFFVVVACLQLAWAGLVVNRVSRRLLLAGAAGNAVVLGVWLLSRTSGVPLVAGARAPEALGLKDTVCGFFEVLLVSGVALFTVMPDAARRARLGADAAARAVTSVGLAVLLLTVPASLATHGHTNDHSGHVDAALAAHEDGSAPSGHGHATHNRSTVSADGSPAADDTAHDHDNGDVAVASADGSHTHTHPSASGSPVVVHNHNATDGATGDDHAAHDHGGPPDTTGAHVHDAACHPTAAQQGAADKLVADTRAALTRWNDQNRAMADGYIQYPPVPAGWAQHYVNFGSLDDGRVMDPRHPESLLYAMTDQGYRPISALYILPHASSQPPDTLGCLAHWHEHPEIFLSRPGENGSPSMLHVFIVPMRGGAFAHEPDPQSVRNLYTPFRVLVNPWYQDGCEGAPWLPGDPYQVIPSCKGWQDGHPAES
jgi:hypothetical protein